MSARQAGWRLNPGGTGESRRTDRDQSLVVKRCAFETTRRNVAAGDDGEIRRVQIGHIVILIGTKAEIRRGLTQPCDRGGEPGPGCLWRQNAKPLSAAGVAQGPRQRRGRRQVGFDQVPALRRGLNAPAALEKQLHAKSLLQTRDRLADRGVREPELGGGGADAAMAAQHFQSVQRLQGRNVHETSPSRASLRWRASLSREPVQPHS